MCQEFRSLSKEEWFWEYTESDENWLMVTTAELDQNIFPALEFSQHLSWRGTDIINKVC